MTALPLPIWPSHLMIVACAGVSSHLTLLRSTPALFSPRLKAPRGIWHRPHLIPAPPFLYQCSTLLSLFFILRALNTSSLRTQTSLTQRTVHPQPKVKVCLSCSLSFSATCPFSTICTGPSSFSGGASASKVCAPAFKWPSSSKPSAGVRKSKKCISSDTQHGGHEPRPLDEGR